MKPRERSPAAEDELATQSGKAPDSEAVNCCLGLLVATITSFFVLLMTKPLSLLSINPNLITWVLCGVKKTGVFERDKDKKKKREENEKSLMLVLGGFLFSFLLLLLLE